jgi:hypothetical protein
MQYDTNNLRQYIPSLNIDKLKRVIGNKLIEIDRSFGKDLSKEISYFLEYYPDKNESCLYSYGTGGTQFYFEDGSIHSFAGYSAEYSIILFPEVASDSWFSNLYKLSESENIAAQELKDCLNTICQDIRIWKFKDDLDPGSLAMEAGISYLLSNGCELFYCTYLHGDYDSDHLLFKSAIQEDMIDTGFSILKNKIIPFN